MPRKGAFEMAKLKPGDKAPNFSLPDTAGVNHSLAQFRGRVVLLNFWSQG